MKTNKITAALLILMIVISLVLTGCKAKNEVPPQEPSQSAETVSEQDSQTSPDPGEENETVEKESDVELDSTELESEDETIIEIDESQGTGGL